MVGVEASSDLRKIDNIFCPLALRIATQPATQASIALEAPSTVQLVVKAPVAAQPVAMGPTTTQPTDTSTINIPELTKAPAKEKRASKGKEIEQSEPLPATTNNIPPSTGS